MAFVQQWWRQPQTTWFRRILFQIHLWVGIAAGLYLIVISVSGSAVVFRREMARSFIAPTPVVVQGQRLSEEAIRQRVGSANPGHQVTSVRFHERPDFAATVSLKHPDEVMENDRRIDPYTGADLGPTLPAGFLVLEWLVDLHDNLLAGQTGRMVNGLGGGLLALLCLTGVLIWWPGPRLWRRRLVPRSQRNWRLFNWELHGAIGLWCLSLLSLWAITGVYFGFPDFFSSIQESFDSTPDDFDRPGDAFIALMVRWHFGRFGGLGVRILWVVLGLAPAVLFFTGGIMWWNRVLRDRGARAASAELPRQAVASRPR
ncbi:MAG: PepSY-associated TM helix domain-containing protein [Vicinamibacterales bacterium]